MKIIVYLMSAALMMVGGAIAQNLDGAVIVQDAPGNCKNPHEIANLLVFLTEFLEEEFPETHVQYMVSPDRRNLRTVSSSQEDAPGGARNLQDLCTPWFCNMYPDMCVLMGTYYRKTVGRSSPTLANSLSVYRL